MSMSLLPALLLLTLGIGVQSSPLSLDVRVFRGAVEVTRDTHVTVFPAGTRTNGQAAPLVSSGERQVSLAAGQYDLQLVQHHEGKVSGIAWTTLRLLVDYPGERGRHLEVLNFDKTFGALQIRRAGPAAAGAPAWHARLVRKDGSEVARGVPGEAYQVLVAPAGTYDVVIESSAGAAPVRLTDVEVRANLTYVRTY